LHFTHSTGASISEQAHTGTVYNAANSAAFKVDPCYAGIEEGAGVSATCSASVLSAEHMNEALSLVSRWGGALAASQFVCLFTQGFPALLCHMHCGRPLGHNKPFQHNR
jgi:hypothetical protein